MSSRVQGKVAFITGAARGQGRSHALRLAEEGARIVAVDILQNVTSIDYPLATPDDLDETVSLVKGVGGEIVARQADVRDPLSLEAALNDGLSQFGRLDVVCANAGICSVQRWNEVDVHRWQDIMDVNVTGVWNTLTLAAPHLIDSGGGSMMVTSSTAGLKGYPFFAPYVASKHAVIGIARSLANELACHKVRVNTLHPAGVDTAMAAGLKGFDVLIEEAPDLGPIFKNTLPFEILEPRDVSEAVLFLASDESRYITGMEFRIDGGSTIR